MGERVKGLSAIEGGVSSIIRAFRTLSALLPIEELCVVPTSTISKESLYFFARKAANLFGSKGFGVGAAEGFTAEICAAAFAGISGVEVALLSERRVRVSSQSICM